MILIDLLDRADRDGPYPLDVSRDWLEKFDGQKQTVPGTSPGFHSGRETDSGRSGFKEDGRGKLTWTGGGLPEYPKPGMLHAFPEKERMQALKETPRVRRWIRRSKTFREKKGRAHPDRPSLPSLQEATHFTHLSDRGETEKVIQRLLNSKEKEVSGQASVKKPRFGMKGPAASRTRLIGTPLPSLARGVEPWRREID